MKYEVINEALKIAACRLSDLTMQQVHHFLKQWDNDSSIGTLTLFFDRESGYIVLNRDNKDYKIYLDIAEGYLGASEEGRRTLDEKAPEGTEQTLLVLRNALIWRKADKDISQALKNHIDDSDRITLNAIMKQHDDISSSTIAFRYGVMCGKRAERARRKKTA